MPTTQKSQQKQTKATQKVGGSAKKPVTKAMEGGSAKKPVTKVVGGGSTKKAVTKAVGGGSAKKPVTKVVGGGSTAPSKGKTTRGGSAKGGSVKTSTTKPRQHIGGVASKTVRRGPSIKKGGTTSVCYKVTKDGDNTYTVSSCEERNSSATVDKKGSLARKVEQLHGVAGETRQRVSEKLKELPDTRSGFSVPYLEKAINIMSKGN